MKDTVLVNDLIAVLLTFHLTNTERQKEIVNKVKDLEGTLIIKEYPTKSASVSTLFKNHIEKLRKRGIEPDMILVDLC